VLGRLARVPVVLAHEHTPLRRRPLRERLLMRQVVARLADRIIAVSDWGRANLIREERVPSHKLALLHNGIEPPVARRDRATVRRELGVPDSQPMLISVAMLRPEKDHETFIAALGRLAQSRPDVVALVVGGDDPFRGYAPGALDALAERAGVAGNIRFLGRRTDAYDLICAADVSVSHSREENLSLAVMEHMAAGRAIVATAVGGTPEMIEHEVTGLLVEPGDPIGMAAAIERLITDADEARRLGRNAAQRQASEFSLEASGRKLDQLYRSRLAARPGRRRRSARSPTGSQGPS
jgi:glycosyltransferase involved in cell wall biosynthesis